MKSYFIGLALNKLSDGCEWTYDDDNLTTLQWHNTPKVIPTIKQIEEMAKELELQEIAKIESDKLAKEALLDRLGITADEAKLLLG